METVSRIKNLSTNPTKSSFDDAKHKFEVVVIEDNHLANTVLSKALNSTISTIHSMKNIAVDFVSFQNGKDFLNYFGSKDYEHSNLIVFSDYYLEENINGVEILKSIKLKKADATVVIMSDSSNSQIAVDAHNSGAYCFLPKNQKTPVICSELLFQMVN